MLPSGLFIQHEVIPEDVEEFTIDELDGPLFKNKWSFFLLSRDQVPKTNEKRSNELSRRKLHQGYRYPYKGGSLQKIEPISDSLLHFSNYIEDNSLMGKDLNGKNISPDQCIVNEYLGDQNISAHIDRKDFGEIVLFLFLS